MPIVRPWPGNAVVGVVTRALLQASRCPSPARRRPPGRPSRASRCARSPRLSPRGRRSGGRGCATRRRGSATRSVSRRSARTGLARLDLLEVVLRRVLLERSVDGGDGLLPGQGEADVQEDDEPGRDQRDGEDAPGSRTRPVSQPAERSAAVRDFAAAMMTTHPHRLPIASYQADPEQVGRVLLLYSGGLDTA